ncbi:hypothetical protein FGLOB1_2601 [Fusarium globosum]|uniref:Uncharacterized protein n=1 Tax=Fusarium globosum TaxID=78864 RepID=A0A8H6DG72_9HYPO|nr:hypothetical protein FGLOB1_2601 [Fusarium globosum]
MATPTSIRSMRMGINPYKNGILLSFTTALPYKPVLCNRVSPFLQVMNFTVCLCAVNIEGKFIIAFPDIDPDTSINRMPYMARFMTMLRYSYVFAKVGLAFPNASPLITEMTDNCMIVLLLSGWFKSVAKICNNCSFKTDRISLGTLETKPSAMLSTLHQFVNEPGETQELGHDLKDKLGEDIHRGSSTRPALGRGGGP